LISNYHVVKDATKVRLLTGAGLIDAKVVQVDAANDLALLKADGRFAPLPIAASRTVNLGGTVATVGFPDIGLQGFAPKLAKGEIASLSGAGDAGAGVLNFATEAVLLFGEIAPVFRRIATPLRSSHHRVGAKFFVMEAKRTAHKSLRQGENRTCQIPKNKVLTTTVNTRYLAFI
jgi:hypothetical protein